MDLAEIQEYIGLASGLKWPAVTLVIVLLFREPIKRIINYFINKKNGHGVDLVKSVEAIEKKVSNDMVHDIKRIDRIADEMRVDFKILRHDVTEVQTNLKWIMKKLNGNQ